MYHVIVWMVGVKAAILFQEYPDSQTERGELASLPSFGIEKTNNNT
jgi:hypothetical protein